MDPGNQAGSTASSHKPAMDPGNQAGSTSSSHEPTRDPGNQAGLTASSHEPTTPPPGDDDFDPGRLPHSTHLLLQAIAMLIQQIEAAEERNKRALAEANQRHQQRLRKLRHEVRQLQLTQAIGDDNLRRIRRKLQDTRRELVAARREDKLRQQQKLRELAVSEAAARHEDNRRHQQEAAVVRERQQQHRAQLATASRRMGAVANILRELPTAAPAAGTSETFREVSREFEQLSLELRQPYDQRLDSARDATIYNDNPAKGAGRQA